MPLVKIDMIAGRTQAEIAELTDAVQDAAVEAFGVPERDRYQIVNEHEPSRLIVQDTGLDIPRTDRVVVIQVTSRPRDTEAKLAFYRLVCEQLDKRCGIAPTDVVVTIVTNDDEDWSFGHGRAQFLTGEL